ncbi:hypothetical protein KC909_05265, partial [Candidatus Dojkabacteria bacterium]|nr:hypothetical protein [Candidatus Dojkabacteria bacterium]
MYSKEYFKLQTIFAQRCAEILGKDLPYCLFHYTANYLRLGLSKPFNENDPTWVSAVKRINAGEDVTEVIYSFYQKRNTNQVVDDRKYFGFFGYDWDDEGKRIKLH